MSKSFVDLTATQNGNERDMYAVLALSRPDILANEVTVAAHEPLQFTDLAVHTVPLAKVSESELQAQLFGELDKLLADETTDNLFVCSFRQSLQHYLLTHQFAMRAQFIDLREILRSRAGASPAVTEWPPEFMAEQEAQRLLAFSLVKHGGSMKMTAVRPRMTDLDGRFRRDTVRKGPTDSSRFIPFLVKRAEQAGLVTLTGSESDPVISVTPRGSALAQAPGASTIQQVPVRNDPAAQQVRGTADAATGTESSASEVYIQTLRSAKFGPFQEVRSALYDALLKAMGSSDPLTVRDLLSRAVETVRGDVEHAREQGGAYLLRDSQRGYPWGRLRAFLAVILTRVPVLKSGNEHLTATWRQLSSPVDGIDDGWRTALDAELIVVLLEAGCAIDIYSEEDLAGALYNSRRPDATAQVQDCIAYLLQSGRCTLTGDEMRLQLTPAR